jgi:hypothetical protein
MMPVKAPDKPVVYFSRCVRSQRELEALAGELSLVAFRGGAILLSGELGAGKSTFARAFIRSLAPPDSDFDIPSPTFNLVQNYPETRIPVAHVDFYRLGSADEAAELGLDELREDGIVIVEWPDRLGALPWADTLRIDIAGSGECRDLRITAEGAWHTALRRNGEIAAFLAATPWAGAARTYLEGDASFRRYEVLRRDGDQAILMDMPARPDGPPVRNGRPYSAIAHLAEDIGAVIAVNRQLCEAGYSAPSVYAFDLNQGLAVIEDLGRLVYATMMAERADMREPMAAAVTVLADMAGRVWPARADVDEQTTRVIPPYDEDAQLIEADLLPSWYWPHLRGREAPAAAREEFAALWRDVLPLARPETPVWTLRDYHSPNLLWLPERAGVRRVGIIDTQDCVLGHPAYDLASLLQDARVDIDFGWADELFESYCALRARQSRFDVASFAAAFAVLGAQRATKILGIFARLSKRDGKCAYLRHMPRVSRYLERNLRHAALARLRKWLEARLPEALGSGPP